MNNKIKMINIALVTGIASTVPYNVLAVENNSLVNIEWNTELVENGLEEFNSIIQTSDGGFLTVGEADVNSDKSGARGDGAIVKYDSNGKVQWSNFLEGNATDLFYNVAETPKGEYYAIGKSFSTNLDFTNSNGISHAIIVKYDNTGTELWTKAVNDNGKQINYTSIIYTKSGNLAIVGDKVIDGERTGFIMFIDEDGDEVSLTKIKNGTNNTTIKNILEISDDKYAIVGSSSIDTSEKPFISLIDSSGNAQWTYTTSDDESELVKVISGAFTSLTKNKNGDLIATGYSVNGDNDDSLIMSFNSEGKKVWYDVVRGDTSDKYTNAFVNSKDEIIVMGESKPKEEVNKLTDLKITVTRYKSDYSMLERTDDLSNEVTNVSTSNAILTTSDKIVAVGKSYKKVLGEEAKCEVTKTTLPEDCIQADAIIMQINVKTAEIPTEEGTKDPCEIKDVPVIKADDVEIYIGDNFKVLQGVTATDKSGKDLTNLIEIKSNTVNTNKTGEYKVVYTVKDECEVSVEKERIVKVIEKPSSGNTIKPQTGDNTLIYIVMELTSVLGLFLLNKRKKTK